MRNPNFFPPVDAGYVIIRPDDTGGTMVVICGGVNNGHPVRPYAVHRHAPGIVIDPDIQLASTGDRTWSMEVVQTVAATDLTGIRIMKLGAITDPVVAG